MRLTFALTLVAVLLDFVMTKYHSKEHWFTQYLKQYNPIDEQVWKQRYFVNSDHHKPNGPVFLYINTERPASDEWVYEGEMFENGKRFGAMMFLLEHRFYGSSQPASDLSVENLVYLTADQALLDMAYFIEGMNRAHELPKGTKWILFGRSYAGSLATWMRAKYPHLVHAAVASSAPLYAKLDFSEYNIVVEDALRAHSQACVDVISNATKEVHDMLSDSAGLQELGKLFKFCDPFDLEKITKEDISYFYQALSNNFASVVQYNKINRSDKKLTIDTICDVLVDTGKGGLIHRYAEVNNMILEQNGDECLINKYTGMIDYLRNVTLTDESRRGQRQWMYQTCTEFSFYQSSTSRPNLFGDHFPIDFFLQQCADIFGPSFSRLPESGVYRTNTVYGGLDLVNSVSNVVFVHGSMDPWHKLGITKSSNPKAPAIFINGTAHCANIYPARKDDLPQLVEARKQVSDLIGQWLQS